MSPIDEAERADMMMLLLREKAAKKDRDEALGAVERWQERVELAMKSGEHALADVAGQKLHDARAQLVRSEHELACVKDEKDVLRRSANRPDDDGSSDRAEALLEDFESLGVRPEDAAFEEMSKQDHAEDMLAALKQKLLDD